MICALYRLIKKSTLEFFQELKKEALEFFQEAKRDIRDTRNHIRDTRNLLQYYKKQGDMMPCLQKTTKVFLLFYLFLLCFLKAITINNSFWPWIYSLVDKETFMQQPRHSKKDLIILLAKNYYGAPQTTHNQLRLNLLLRQCGYEEDKIQMILCRSKEEYIDLAFDFFDFEGIQFCFLDMYLLYFFFMLIWLYLMLPKEKIALMFEKVLNIKVITKIIFALDNLKIILTGINQIIHLYIKMRYKLIIFLVSHEKNLENIADFLINILKRFGNSIRKTEKALDDIFDEILTKGSSILFQYYICILSMILWSVTERKSQYNNSIEIDFLCQEYYPKEGNLYVLIFLLVLIIYKIIKK